MLFSQIGSVIGGLGLMMLGMRMMTLGLKEAAGPSLKQMLAQWTGTRLRGVCSGTIITFLVQSSSAVSIATIGFVNAGLMNLNQAIHILYGANIGTTFTGWLVVFIGFKLDIKLIMLPLIGLGVGLKMLLASKRSGMFGEALAGFGVFFLGIEFLTNTFNHLANNFQLQTVDTGFSQIMIFFSIGLVLTVLMESSSAVIAMILASVNAGMISLNIAAALIIGANVGTTSTAALAMIGASANAKRAAVGQIVFNLFTGLVALIVLSPLLAIASFFGKALGTAVILVFFDTLFNILGVVLIWPFTSKLVEVLEKCFLAKDSENVKAQYLDKAVLKTPALALNSILLELRRIFVIAYRMLEVALSSEERSLARLETDRETIVILEDAIAEYIAALQRNELTPQIANSLPLVLRIMAYLDEIADLSLAVANSEIALKEFTGDEISSMFFSHKAKIASLLDDFQKDIYAVRQGEFKKAAAEIFLEYEELKKNLLQKATQGELKARELVAYLELLTSLKRIVQRSEKEVDYLSQILKLEEGLLITQPAKKAVAG